MNVETNKDLVFSSWQSGIHRDSVPRHADIPLKRNVSFTAPFAKAFLLPLVQEPVFPAV